MSSKKKQEEYPAKTTQHEDIYLNDMQVDIKQEEELIIEDADHVQWRIVGIDDGDDATKEIFGWKDVQSQNTSYQQQIVSGIADNQLDAASFDEVIEISDEEIYNYEDEVTSGGDNSEMCTTNESFQFIILETPKKHSQASPPRDTTEETESVCSANDPIKANIVRVNEVKYSGNFVQKLSDCELKETSPSAFNNDKIIGNVDYFNAGTFSEWMSRKLVKMCCHICGVEFHGKIYSWLSHMKLNHPKILKEISNTYTPVSESVVLCKDCKMNVTPKINHTFHYLTRHIKPTPQIFACSFCDYKTFSVATLQGHQLENHPTVIDKRENCPKCDESFKDSTALVFHFMSAHIREFNGKYVYKCHLCDGVQFESSKKKLFAHLIDKHKLANWKILNYRKIENFLSCSKCHKIFIKSNMHNLLGHYLTHEEKSHWSCKYCNSTNRFKDWPVPHLCRAMRTYLEVKNKAANGKAIDKINAQQSTQCEGKEERIVSWNEFETYIEHICPFCSKGFLKFEEWRRHVREAHYIHTLQGLNMAVLPQEKNTLLCLECSAHVPKSALELHKHRFQHLPFEPYKCRHCAKSLATYNAAINHVQNNCQDGEKLCGGQNTDDQTPTNRNDNVTPSQQSASEGVIILCPLCNNKRFPNHFQLSKHFDNVHDNFDKYFTKPPKDRPRSCKVCASDMKNNKLTELVAHYLQHLNERPFKCQKCSRSYPVYRKALRHVRSYHLNSTNAENCFSPIKDEAECHLTTTLTPKNEPECHLSTTPKQELDTESHLTIATIPAKNSIVTPDSNCRILLTTPTPQKSSTPIKEDDSKETLKVADFKSPMFKTYEKYIRFFCPECNDTFKTHIKWENHINSEHSFYKGKDLRLKVARGKGKVKCLDCHVQLPLSASKQHNHKLIHMPFRSFACTLCLNHFTTTAAVYKHLDTHFNKGNYKCDICFKTLASDFERLQHVKENHICEKWPSNMCNTCYKIVKDMEDHLRNNHLDHSRKYRCETCGVYLEFPKELQVHMHKIHSTAIKTNEISLQVAKTINRSGEKRKLRSLSSDGNAKKKDCPSPVSPSKRGRFK